jgi:hypothetical protein
MSVTPSHTTDRPRWAACSGSIFATRAAPSPSHRRAGAPRPAWRRRGRRCAAGRRGCDRRRQSCRREVQGPPATRQGRRRRRSRRQGLSLVGPTQAACAPPRSPRPPAAGAARRHRPGSCRRSARATRRPSPSTRSSPTSVFTLERVEDRARTDSAPVGADRPPGPRGSRDARSSRPSCTLSASTSRRQPLSRPPTYHRSMNLASEYRRRPAQ